MAITTSSSINVNADRRPERRVDMTYSYKETNNEGRTSTLMKLCFIFN
jgi:hypothetical protein